MTPHVGCFEVLPVWLAHRFFTETKRNITILYRPPKKEVLRRIVGEARQAPGIEAVPTNLAGVKRVIRNLRLGHTFGALPDQDARLMNRRIEEIVRRLPEQYAWSYNRYKVPRGALPPPGDAR